MRGHIPQPVDAGGLERHVGVEAAGDGTVDGGLAGFLQEGDQLLFGVDVALDAAVKVVEVACDGLLFGEGWEGKSLRRECGVAKVGRSFSYSCSKCGNPLISGHFT